MYFVALAGVLLTSAPDLLFINVTIPTHPGVQALAVENGKISALGTQADLKRSADKHTKVIDGQGRMLIPGMIDSHIHFISGGIAQTRVKLDGAKSEAELLARVKQYAQDNPNAAWISGRGFSYDLFKNRKPAYPTRQMLDSVVPDRPVFVRAYDGHTGWANTKALELAKVTAATPDPKTGKIIREADGKTPAGALLEDAMELLWEAMPKTTPQERRDGALAAQALAVKHGLTAINDFAADSESADTYLALEKEGLLHVKVFFSPAIETPLEEAKALREKLKNSKRVHFGSLKGFVDGVVESDTAAFIHPYADNPKVRGEAHLKPADLEKYIVPADAEGFVVSLHAIGDLAVRTSLDAFEKAAKTNKTSDRRHRIEHIEVLDPADAPRFKTLGVVASMQPLHAEPSDKPGPGVWETKVGKKRMPHIFAWKELSDAGARLAFGSDWAVVTLDPLMGLAVATSRRNGHGLPVDGWVQAQKLDFAKALKAYTEDAAWALHADDTLGRLDVGRAADLVLVSEKAESEEPLSLYWGQVDLTLIDGKPVYDRALTVAK